MSDADSVTISCYKDISSHPNVLDRLISLITLELSEPYSVYTFRYFLFNWPELALLAIHGGDIVGVVLCKLNLQMRGDGVPAGDTEDCCKRGYIGMVAVAPEFRRRGIGSRLTSMAIDRMKALGAEEVKLQLNLCSRREARKTAL